MVCTDPNLPLAGLLQEYIGSGTLEKINLAIIGRARKADEPPQEPPTPPQDGTPPSDPAPDTKPEVQPEAEPNGKLASKKPEASKIRTAIGNQLRYIKRNLGSRTTERASAT